MIDRITVKDNLREFNDALSEYLKLSKKSVVETLVKQGTKLSFALSQRLRGLAPGKGTIRAERLSSLKSGRGVKVRPSVVASVMRKYHARTDVASRKTVFMVTKRKSTLLNQTQVKRKRKLLNLRALMVQKELNIRESGRGFLGFGARMNVSKVGISKLITKYGRYRQQLGNVGLIERTDEQGLRFEFGAPGSEFGAGMSTAKATSALKAALKEVVVDIREYLARKQVEQLERELKRKLKKLNPA